MDSNTRKKEMLRRIPVIVTLVVCTALGCAGQSGDQGKAQSDAASADRTALIELIQRSVAEIRHAWEVKDAKLVFKDTGQEPAVRTPDGRAISHDDQIADIQRRMNIIKKGEGNEQVMSGQLAEAHHFETLPGFELPPQIVVS